MDPSRKIMILALTATGAFFLIALIKNIRRNGELLHKAPGKVPVLCLCQFAVYFCTAFGLSDYTMNAALLRPMGLVRDEDLPGTLLAAASIPSVELAVLYVLRFPVPVPLLLAYTVPLMLGITLGARVGSRLSGNVIRIVMGCGMTLSAAVLMIRLLAHKADGGTLTALAYNQMILLGIVMFFLGAFNTIGFGAKTPAMALLLTMGLAPQSVLALAMTGAGFGAPCGGYQYVRCCRYQPKVVLSAVIFGSLAALLGGVFVSRVSSGALQWIMVGIMLYTAADLLLHKKSQPEPKEAKL